jgi:hypothetical protein
MGLKLIFLVVTRAVSVLGLSRRESWWKDAEILMLRHQLAVALRERPRPHSRLTWPDRAWLRHHGLPRSGAHHQEPRHPRRLLIRRPQAMFPAEIQAMVSFMRDSSMTGQRLRRGSVRRMLSYARPYRVQVSVYLAMTVLAASTCHGPLVRCPGKKSGCSPWWPQPGSGARTLSPVTRQPGPITAVAALNSSG